MFFYQKIFTFALTIASLSVHAADNNYGDAGAVLEEETRVYLGTCFFSDVKTPAKPPVEQEVQSFLLPGVVAVLAETVIDFTIGALKAAGEDKSMQAIAAYPANGWMYQLDKSARLVINPDGRCIQIISGSFWNGFRVLENENEAPSRDPSKIVKLDNRKKSKTIDPSGEKVTVDRWDAADSLGKEVALFKQIKARYRQLRWARFFFEARIEPLKGTNDKFIIAPSALYFEKPVEKRFFEADLAKRNLLVTLSIANAGAEVGKAFASVNFPFREVPSNTLLTPLYFSGHTSRAIQVPELTEEEKKDVLAKKTKLEKASSEVKLVKGLPSGEKFETPNSFENENYKKAAEAYCKELDKFNTTLTNKEKAALKATAPECPVDVQVAKMNLSKANDEFIKFTTKQEAQFNTDKYWLIKESDPKNIGVSCDPINEMKENFQAQCTLTGNAKELRPITISASVIEVKEGSKFAAFLGKALEKGQPAINAAIEAKTPNKQAEATEKLKENQDAYQLALADVATAEAKVADLPADATATQKATAQRELLNAKIAANQSARKAGLPEKYQIP